MRSMYFVALISCLVLSFTSSHVSAQSNVDEEIRLSKLTVSAFECSIVAPDQTEFAEVIRYWLCSRTKVFGWVEQCQEWRGKTVEGKYCGTMDWQRCCGSHT